MHAYHVLADTDSACLMFLFICEVTCSTPSHGFRNIIFKVIRKTHIKERFDTSHTFSENFNARDFNIKETHIKERFDISHTFSENFNARKFEV